MLQGHKLICALVPRDMLLSLYPQPNPAPAKCQLPTRMNATLPLSKAELPSVGLLDGDSGFTKPCARTPNFVVLCEAVMEE